MKESRRFLDLYNLDITKEDFDYRGNITILEMKKKVAKDLGSTRWILMKEIKRYPIDIKTEVTVEKIEDGCVQIRNKEKTEKIPAEVVILATGYKPAMRELSKWLESSKYNYQEIGDCGGNGQGVMNAIEEAYGIKN
jgi:NADH dehydrogenase FAD-containing subunit